MNDVITNEPTIDEPHEVALRRSQQQRRNAIWDDYVVYLQELEFDLGIDDNPTSFSQVMKSANYFIWLDVMKGVLKSMD